MWDGTPPRDTNLSILASVDKSETISRWTAFVDMHIKSAKYGFKVLLLRRRVSFNTNGPPKSNPTCRNGRCYDSKSPIIGEGLAALARVHGTQVKINQRTASQPDKIQNLWYNIERINLGPPCKKLR